jgi:ring-1,2-phenylacetyl-CoA epoxidase subunit PaaD
VVIDSSRVQAAIAALRDPEIRVLTIEELGILRDVRVDGGTTAIVTITPTYSGCPAMDRIRADIRTAASEAGCDQTVINTVFSPAWTTDWLTEEARTKLAAAGIAPPSPCPSVPAPGRRVLPLVPPPKRCPRCDSSDTTEVSRFGSTACKALWRCTACHEPFEGMKEH